MNGKVVLIAVLALSCLIATVVCEPNPQPRPDTISVTPTDTAGNANSQKTDAGQTQSKKRGFMNFSNMDDYDSYSDSNSDSESDSISEYGAPQNVLYIIVQPGDIALGAQHNIMGTQVEESSSYFDPFGIINMLVSDRLN
ncbi:unnamed protein product [Colias eurytheme]|nr:unnamed protein product [Colias eurytheme]